MKLVICFTGPLLSNNLYCLHHPLPCHAHAECYTGVGTERNKLLAGLAKYMVHAQIEVVALGMNVEHPTETGGKAAHSHVDAAVKPLGRCPVGTQSALSPGIVTVETGAAEEAEGQFAINRQRIFTPHIDGGTDTGRTLALVALVRRLMKSVIWSP